MKKINLAVPAMLAAALALSACDQKDAGNSAVANDVTQNELTLNEGDPVIENSVDNAADPLAGNQALLDNLIADNAVSAGNAR